MTLANNWYQNLQFICICIVFQAKSSEAMRVEKRALIDAQSVFAKLKPKKISQKAKKDFARQSLQDIVSTSQKNFGSFKHSIGPQKLGIICKKTSSQETLEIQECENNLNIRNNTQNGIEESKSNPMSDERDNDNASDVLINSPASDSDFSGQSKSNQTSPQPPPGPPNTEVSSCSDSRTLDSLATEGNNLSLVSYDFSASDSDGSV